MGSYALSQNTSTTNNINKPLALSDVEKPFILSDAAGNKIGSQESSITMGSNGSLQLNSLDGGAINQAFGFAGKSIEAVADMSRNLNQALTGINQQAIGAIQKAQEGLESSKAGGDILSNKTAIYAAVVLGIAYFWSRK